MIRFITNARALVKLVCLALSFIIASGAYAQASLSDGAIVPVIGLLLNDPSNSESEPPVAEEDDTPLTSNLDVECAIELSSFSPPAGSDIDVGEPFSATFDYQINQRPLDVELRIFSSVVSVTGSGLIQGDEIIVGIGQGANSMNGQITLSQINTGANGRLELETLSASCLAFTLFDAEDASNNPGPNIGSRVQITRAGLQSVQRIVNWTLLPIGVE